MYQEKLEECSYFIVPLGEVLRDRHTDIQNDSDFMKVFYGILSTFEQYSNNCCSQNPHISRYIHEKRSVKSVDLTIY